MNTVADPIHDQALAAFDEAARTVQAVPSVPVERTPITSRVLAKWARGLAPGQEYDRHSVARNADEQHDWTSCGHLEAAQQCFGLAHLPGHLMCGPCWLAAAERSEDACDWCGLTRKPDTTIWPAMYAIGPCVVLLMVCDHHIGRGCEFHCCDLREYVRGTLLNIADSHS